MTIEQVNAELRNWKRITAAKPAQKTAASKTAKKVALVKPRRKLPANTVTIRCKFNPASSMA
jgi:hypothetical protein